MSANTDKKEPDKGPKDADDLWRRALKQAVKEKHHADFGNKIFAEEQNNGFLPADTEDDGSPSMDSVEFLDGIIEELKELGLSGGSKES